VCLNLLLVEIQILVLACEWAEVLEAPLLLETVTADDHHPQHKARSRHPHQDGQLRHLEAEDEYHPQCRPCPQKRASFPPQPRLNLHLTAVEPG